MSHSCIRDISDIINIVLISRIIFPGRINSCSVLTVIGKTIPYHQILIIHIQLMPLLMCFRNIQFFHILLVKNIWIVCNLSPVIQANPRCFSQSTLKFCIQCNTVCSCIFIFTFFYPIMISLISCIRAKFQIQIDPCITVVRNIIFLTVFSFLYRLKRRILIYPKISFFFFSILSGDQGNLSSLQ